MFFFFQAEDGIRDDLVTGVQTCALPILCSTFFAMAQVTSEKKVLHIVSGGHTDPITGANCSWNVFRVCNSTTMDANAIAQTLMEKFGKKWYFLTPAYAYGHSVQAGFAKLLQAAGGNSAAALLPL